MIDRKPVFDAIKAYRGGASFTPAHVQQIDALLDTLTPTAPAITVPADSKFPLSVVTSAMRVAALYPASPASVQLAQWALESGYGKSVSGKNNYGGITAKVQDAVFPYEPGKPLEPATLCWTHEQYKGQRVSCQRWFKDFDTPDAFFEAHAKLLATGKPYAAARAKLPDLLAYIDVMGPVYATDPNYATTIKSIIRSNNLRQYDV